LNWWEDGERVKYRGCDYNFTTFSNGLGPNDIICTSPYSLHRSTPAKALPPTLEILMQEYVADLQITTFLQDSAYAPLSADNGNADNAELEELSYFMTQQLSDCCARGMWLFIRR
jgi:hypothetical protein